MKTIYYFFLSLFIFFLPLQKLFPQQKNNFQEQIVIAEQKAHASIFDSPAIQATNNYDVKFHRLELIIDPAVYFITGKVTTHFVPTSSLTQLEFDLALSLTVDSVKYNNAPLVFSQLAGGILQINFPSALPALTLDSVTVYYQGPPGTSGFGSFINSIHGASSPVMWTLSEPYGAKTWWPCKQTLNDKIDSVDMIVTTPMIYRVASNGLLISEDTIGVQKKYHWKTRYPIAAYLVAVAITDYAVYSDLVITGTDTLEVLNYVYPEDLANAQSQTPVIIPIIKLYDSLTVDYPFKNEKYGHAQFGWGGGMEHQTMSFMSSFNTPLVAHECAHQWFGDKVTCGSWQDIWLNEGFATYFEGLTAKRLFPATWHDWLQQKKSGIIAQPGGSVWCDDTTSVSRIFDGRLSYSKGAYLLHMLRWTLGDSLFFQSLKNYLNDPQIAYSFGTTQKLKTHLENTGGKDLTIFFDQWYYKQGFPTYDIGWEYKEGVVTVLVDQTQSHASVAFFEMPIPMEFTNGVKDTTIIFNNTSSGETFTVALPFEPTEVYFDPELWILSGNNTVSKKTPLDDGPGHIYFYPNPAVNDKIIIELINYFEPLSSVEIIDALGRTVFKEDYSSLSLNRVEVNLHSFAHGVYHMRVKAGENYAFQKIMKVL